MGADLREF
jgi:dynein heavy chain